MAFFEARFPTNVSYGAIGGAGWSTRVVDTDGGYTFRQAMWVDPRGKWTIDHELRTPAEWAELITFHRVMEGKLHGFRFLDWSDFTVEDSQLGLILNTTGTTMQMFKKYRVTDTATSAFQEYHRKILKPQPDGQLFPLTIFQDGVEMVVQPTVDFATGIVSVSSTDGHIYSWTGSFDVPVRFDTDLPNLAYDDFNIVSWRGITIVELLPQDLA